MRLSVIIPVRNGVGHIHHCLEALSTSTRLPDEVIVVDDSSTDWSADIARQFDAQVIELRNGPFGPATARNRGAASARGNVLVFIDADVLIHPETLEKMCQILIAHPEIDALFGSYDESPPYRGIVSLYKNLQHHYVHQNSRREASTFWAGCGAVRREIFLNLSGFDESYIRPSVEDIELGLRMVQSGYRIWLCPQVQATHLKEWTIWNWLRADILDRAVPWTQLIFQTAHLPSDLNLDTKSRVSAVAAWGAVLSFGSGFLFPPVWTGTLLAATVIGFLNRDLYRFFASKGGTLFAIRSFGLHTLYYLYSSLTFVVLFAWHKFNRRISERPKTSKWSKRISEEPQYD